MPDGVGWNPTQKGGQQCRSHTRSAGSIGGRCRAEWPCSSTLRVTVASRPLSGSVSTARPCASGGSCGSSRRAVCRPRRIPDATVRLIAEARREFGWGACRTRLWLLRVHQIKVAAKTIARICADLGLPRAQGAEAPRRAPRQLKLFEKATPGESVQVDVKVVTVNGTKAYQYTACDDCTRYRVLRLFPRLNTRTSVDFLAELRRVLPFSSQRVQTDHGTEFSFGARHRMGKWNAATASTTKSSGAAPPSAPLPRPRAPSGRGRHTLQHGAVL